MKTSRSRRNIHGTYKPLEAALRALRGVHSGSEFARAYAGEYQIEAFDIWKYKPRRRERAFGAERFHFGNRAIPIGVEIVRSLISTGVAIKFGYGKFKYCQR